MAKKLGFDVGKLKEFITIYEQQAVNDDYGSSSGVQLVEVTQCRAWKQIQSKTSQSQTQGGAFDFYQVYSFTIRDNPNVTLTSDMILENAGLYYTIHGITPLENIPNYITLTTSVKI